MTYVLGANKILSIRQAVVDPWKPIGCLTSNTINETIETLSTTTRANNGWSTQITSNQSYTISFSGVQRLDQTSQTLNFQGFVSVKTLKRNGTLIQWKIEDIENGTIEIGDGYITEISDVSDVGGFATFDGVITGYGPVVEYVDDTPPSAPVLSLTSQDSEKITIEWTASSDDIGVVGYIIYRNDVVFDNVSGGTLIYEDYSILNGLIYTYNVQAVDSNNNASALSNKVISSLVGKPGEAYLILEGSPSGVDVLLLESDGSPLLLESV